MQLVSGHMRCNLFQTMSSNLHFMKCMTRCHTVSDYHRVLLKVAMECPVRFLHNAFTFGLCVKRDIESRDTTTVEHEILDILLSP